MAETVHLFLKANGADIKGESTQTSLGREGTIECVAYEQGVTTAREGGGGQATGRRVYEPIKVLKRIDKASPLIAKALVKNEKIDAKFQFFRPNPTGDGTTEQFFTVEIANGRVAHQKQIVHLTTSEEHMNEAPVEEVSFTFHTITWTYTNGGVSHSDSWSQNA